MAGESRCWPGPVAAVLGLHAAPTGTLADSEQLGRARLAKPSMSPACPTPLNQRRLADARFLRPLTSIAEPGPARDRRVAAVALRAAPAGRASNDRASRPTHHMSDTGVRVKRQARC